MKKFYIVGLCAESDLYAIYELTNAEVNGIRKVMNGKSIGNSAGGGYCGSIYISETGYKTLEEAEEALHDEKYFD